MTKYTFDISNSNRQYIGITVSFEVNADVTKIQLPSWRPGRYELANFAKNVRNFKVYNENKQSIDAVKVSKDCWHMRTKGLKLIQVHYSYYASELNAGSTFLDSTQLYVNPVNCCVFNPEKKGPVEIKLNIPEDWKVATSMDYAEGLYLAADADELFDSPFIASANLQHEEYISNNVKFHVWFNGEIKVDWERVLKDFQAFTDKQMEKFIEFPVQEYHFLNQILPYKAYHGVEHQKSTVISLGPSYEVFNSLYKELLGVSSHELYHTWNVKAIRPIEMYPYRWNEENYSKLGYLCEGVTTYMGDLFLLKSGVFTTEQYLKELNQQLQKHFDNPARFHASVGESSFDTWLDGYVQGAPGRKVSIYTEGCLLSFVIDVRIRRATGNKYGLDEVMKRLYFNFALKNKGVSELDYKSTIENVSGESFDEFYNNYVNGNKPYESILIEALDYLGLEMNNGNSKSYAESRLGFKYVTGNKARVTAMFPGGPAELGGMMLNDELISVNNMVCNNDLDKWLDYFDADSKILSINRGGRLIELTLPEVNRSFYQKYSVSKLSNPNKVQMAAFEAWKK